MSPRVLPPAVGMALLLGAVAGAQDSVSNIGFSIPGDAAFAWDAGDQSDSYVVELAPFLTGWGTRFGIAPIVKARKASSFFGNDQISAQSISPTLVRGMPYASPSYAVWHGRGKGLRAGRNDAPDAFVTPSGVSSQFAVGFSSFGTSDNGFSENNVVGAVVNFNPHNPTRLYVRSTSAAINSLNQDEDRSQFGYGSVDALGNIYLRADGFGSLGPNALTDNNIFRVNLGGRNTSVLNLIDASGAADGPATTWILQKNPTVHSTPSSLPADIFGRPIYAGANFNGEYVTEPLPGVTAATAAINNCTGASRGTVSFSRTTLFAGTLGTCMLMSQDLAGQTNSMLAWGVTNNGIPAGGSLCATIPPTITDNEDMKVLNVFRSQAGASQVPFRGGNGQVAMGRDQNGDVLMAFTVTTADEGVPDNANNAIVVAKIDPGTMSIVGWTAAAYIDPLSGKDIEDGNGNVVGRMIPLNQLTLGVPNGPSMSSPMIDSVGNIWFQGTIERFLPGGGSDLDQAILRAVYDPATFSYKLERVIDVGQSFFGKTSGTRWQITFMTTADSNSITSTAPWSGNLLQQSFNDRPVTGLATRDSLTLGGMVFVASITYDSDGDGVFDVNLGFDERYSCLIYVGHWPQFSGATFDLPPISK